MSVIKQSQHSPGGGNTRATPWQQNREDSAQTRIVFGYVIVLYSRHTDELWLCDMTSSSPDEVIVVNRLKYIFFCYSTLFRYLKTACPLVMASSLSEMCLYRESWYLGLGTYIDEYNSHDYNPCRHISSKECYLFGNSGHFEFCCFK